MNLGLLLLSLSHQFTVGVDLPPNPLAIEWLAGLLEFAQFLLLGLCLCFVLADGFVLVAQPLLVFLPQTGCTGGVEGRCSRVTTLAD